MKTYKITSDQISQLHNASCYLKYAMENADELLKSDSQIVKNLKAALSYLEPIRKDLVDKKDIDHDKIYEQAKKLASDNNIKHTIWSIYDIDSLLDESEIPLGAIITAPLETNDSIMLTSEHDERGNKFAYWIDLWKAVDKLAADSGFGNHVFIEGFHKVKKSDNVYAVSLGS